MKERLMDLFNTMQRIETHGESTLMMADCLREVARIIADMNKETEEEE